MGLTNNLGRLSDALTTNASLNVGIGTTSPSAKLHLYGAYPELRLEGNSDATGSGFISFYRPTLGTDGYIQSGANGMIYYAETNTLFYNGTVERVRITNAGNVGIGTTSPSYLLTINSNNTQTSFGLMTGYTNANARNWGIATNVTAFGDFAINQSNTLGGLPFGAGTTRLYMSFNGNLLLGTTTDSGERLQVNGTGRFVNQLRAYNLLSDTTIKGSSYVELSPDQSTYNAWNIRVGAQAADACYYITGGGVNILTTQGYNNPYTVKLYSNGVQTLTMTNGAATFSSLGTGTVYSNGGTLTNTNPSDEKLKTNIIPISYGLNEILQLNPVTFNWKEDKINQGIQYGFIAQDVKKIMPELVKDGEYLGLDKEAIFTILVKAIQELKSEIETLKNK